MFQHVAFRTSLWLSARLLPFRVRHRSLTDVLGLLRSGPSELYRGLPLAYIVKRVRRTARRPILMRDRRCLREGMLAFQYLTAAGYKPELHFGIDTTSVSGPSLKAHCWIVCDNETVLNGPDATMKPILVYRDGVASPAVPSPLADAALD
jgi:hypothetical protein